MPSVRTKLGTTRKNTNTVELQQLLHLQNRHETNLFQAPSICLSEEWDDMHYACFGSQ